MTFLLCDPGWFVHTSDVLRNKRDDNTHTNTDTSHATMFLCLMFVGYPIMAINASVQHNDEFLPRGIDSIQ